MEEMTEAKQLIAEIQERLNRLNELLDDNKSSAEMAFHSLIASIESNAQNNQATITNVKLWADSWRDELPFKKGQPVEPQPRKLQPGDQAPAIEWLKQLEEPWRRDALRMVEDAPFRPSFRVDRPSEAVMIAFNWDGVNNKWHDYYKSLQAQGK